MEVGVSPWSSFQRMGADNGDGEISCYAKWKELKRIYGEIVPVSGHVPLMRRIFV